MDSPTLSDADRIRALSSKDENVRSLAAVPSLNSWMVGDRQVLFLPHRMPEAYLK